MDNSYCKWMKIGLMFVIALALVSFVSATCQTGTPFFFNVNVDDAAPNITLIHPQDNFTAKKNFINFTWNVTDNVDANLSCNLTIDGIVNATNITSANGLLTNYTVTGLNDGTHSWNVTCADDDGNINTSKTRTFLVDTKLPGVNLIFPPNNHYTSQTGFNFTWIAVNGFDTNLTCNLTIDGAVNASNIASLNNTLTNYSVGGLSEGAHTWNVTCVDDANNVNISETRTFTIDLTPPTVTVLNCTPDPADGGAAVTCTANVTDNIQIGTVFANVTHINGSVLPQTTLCSGNATVQLCNFTYTETTSKGLYNVSWLADDPAGNNDTAKDNFTVLDVSSPVITPVSCVPDPANIGVTVNCTANLTDNLQISAVWANATHANSSVIPQNVACIGTNKSQSCSFIFTKTTIAGLYNVTWYANDTSSNNATPALDNFSVAVAPAAPAAPTRGSGGGSGSAARRTYQRIPKPEEKPPGPPTKISEVIKKYKPEVEKPEKPEKPEVRKLAALPAEEKVPEKPRILLLTILMLIFIILFIIWYYWWRILGGKKKKKRYIQHKQYDVPTKKLEKLDQGWVRMIRNAERSKDKAGTARIITEKPKPLKQAKAKKPKIKIAKRAEEENLDQDWLRMISNAKRTVTTKRPSRPRIKAETVAKTGVLPKKESILGRLPKIRMPRIDTEKMQKYGAVMIDRVKQVEQAIKILKPERPKKIEKIEKPELKTKIKEEPKEEKIKVIKSRQNKEEIINKMQKAMKFKDKKQERTKTIPGPAERPSKETARKEEKSAETRTEQNKEKDPVIEKLKNVYKL
ncbi:hypothetical protein GF371_05545 [Candidatus Woesearchaeota archaeon]|nr:hypothetical protein [Candidatus Woesearchaeota archaeon]